MKTINSKKIWVKVVALTLIQTFLGWNAATAAVTGRSLWEQRGKISQIGTSVSSNILEQENLQKALFSDYFVPETAGTINEFWVPKGMDQEALSSSKLLIHVRDAHCNYEAQGNIAKIITNFTETNGLNFVSVEASEGDFDYSLLNSYPDYRVRRNVSDAFMKMGRITGVDYANINAEEPFIQFGAETQSVYNSNLENFRKSLTYKEDGVNFIRQIKESLAALKANMYTPELKELEEMATLYDNREISFVDYCQYLFNLPAAENVRSGYKNFAYLMEAIRVQDLVDFSQVDSEKDALVTELVRKITREDLTELSQVTIDFQRGKLSTANYYQFLENQAKDVQVDLASYKNLRPYMLYLNIYEEIDSAELFQEKETLEAEVKRSMFKNLDQARLDKLSKNADILEKVFSVRLTNSDLNYFQEFRTDFTVYEFESFIREHAPRYNLAVNIDFSVDPLDIYLPKLEAFYSEARTRDALLVENTLAQMDLEGINTGMLVSGGFHTAGITAYLRSKNIPYMVVTPRILREDVNNPYLDLISGGLLPVEKFLLNDFLLTLGVPPSDDAVAAVTGAMSLAGGPAPAWQAKAVDALAGRTVERKIFAGNDVLVQYNEAGQVVGIVPETGSEGAVEEAIKTAAREAGVEDPQVSRTAIPGAEGAEVVRADADTAEGVRGKMSPEEAALVAKAAETAVSFQAFVDAQTGGIKDVLDTAILPALRIYLARLFENDEAKVEAALADLQVFTAENQLGAGNRERQHPGFVNPQTGVPYVSRGYLVLLANDVRSGDPIAQSLFVGLVAHELFTASQYPARQDEQAAVHTDALAAVDSNIIKEQIVPALRLPEEVATKLNSLDQLLTSPDSATEAQNAALANAAAEVEAAPDDAANIAAALSAEVAARSSVGRETPGPEAAVFAQVDRAVAPTLIASLAGKDAFVAINVAEKTVVTSQENPAAIDEVQEDAQTKVDPELSAVLAEKGVQSVVLASGVSAEAKRAVLEIVLGQDIDFSADDAATQVVGSVPGVQAQVFRYDSKGFAIVLQPKVDEDQTVTSALVNSRAILANIQGVEQPNLITIDVDDMYRNGTIVEESLDALRVGVADVSNNTSIRFQLVSKEDPARAVQVAAALEKTKVAKTGRILVGEEIPDDLNIAKRSLISSNAALIEAQPSEVKVISLTGTAKIVAYNAALPLAAIAMVQDPATIAFAIELSNKLGLGLTESEVRAFIVSPSGNINFPTIQELQINTLSIRLAIAA